MLFPLGMFDKLSSIIELTVLRPSTFEIAPDRKIQQFTYEESLDFKWKLDGFHEFAFDLQLTFNDTSALSLTKEKAFL
jgi:hypothetical protein